MTEDDQHAVSGPPGAWLDARDWIARATALGELRVVRGASWQSDISQITELLDHQDNCAARSRERQYNSGQCRRIQQGGGVILEGQFTIQAPQARVWAAIWDIPKLATWVPGCTAAVQVDDETYRAHLEQQVGFLKASFDLLLKVVETDPPQRIRLHGEGEDRRLRSNVKVETEVMLEPIGDATVVRYRHDVSVFGRLGALGFPLIQRKARELEAEFARRASAGLAEA